MTPSSAVFFMVGCAALGFLGGLFLESMMEGPMSKVQLLASGAYFEFQNNPLLNMAFMSKDFQGLIQEATVSFELDKITVDPDYKPDSGDEYFDNVIRKCVFHSQEPINEPVCLVCKLVDKEIEPCENLWLDFLDFDDGDFEDDINAANLGFTIKGVANGGQPNGLYVWNPDLNHPSVEDIIDALPGVPGTNTEDDDIENEAPAAGEGDCGDCDGSKFHILVFADDDGNLAVQPPTLTPDGVPEPMDDSERGGTVTITLDTPKHWVSFDIADIERDKNAVAKAYSKTSLDGSCDTTSLIKTVPIPTTNNAEVQTVFVNANNVSCLTVSWDDSGGLTNFDFKCIKKFDHDDVIAKSIVELPEGYVGSTPIEFEFPEPLPDVQDAVGVAVGIQGNVINFEGLAHGDDHDKIKDYLLGNFHIFLEVQGNNGIDEAIIYDSRHLGPGAPNDNTKNGCDFDLEHPLMPDDLSVGNLIVMKEKKNSCGQPNDSGKGGTLRFRAFHPITTMTIDVVDHDNNMAEVRTYESFDCTGPSNMVPITNFNFERSLQTLDISDTNVRCIEIPYPDSGGFTNIPVPCPKFDKNKIKKIFIGFEDDEDELSNWSLDTDPTRTTTSAPGNIIFELDDDDQNPGPRTGDNYLGGSGNLQGGFAAFNRSFDISEHTDVLLSLWYSWEDTETTDEFELYIRVDSSDSSDWQEILKTDPAPGNQLPWQNLVVNIPEGDELEIQFRWQTSSNREHVMIDHLELLGKHIG